MQNKLIHNQSKFAALHFLIREIQTHPDMHIPVVLLLFHFRVRREWFGNNFPRVKASGSITGVDINTIVSI
jgi:hypothetical protein